MRTDKGDASTGITKSSTQRTKQTTQRTGNADVDKT